MKDRIRKAFRTNEPQRNALALFLVVNVIACASVENCPWYVWVVAIAVWPLTALLINLIDPILVRQDGK